MEIPYIIFETANFHGGDTTVLKSLIDAVSEIEYGGRKGIKFHTISADALALPDFYAYPIYEELQLGSEVWSEIIKHADQALDVWLELADRNCAEVLLKNRAHVYGVKFQASMLENREVFEILPEAQPETLKTIVNVSGLEISRIESCIERLLRTGLAMENLVLQIGFQDYPTDIKDTMLNKVSILQHAFPGVPIGLADHVKGDQGFAKVVPSLACVLVCKYVEKHVCNDRSEAKYDFYSALNPTEAQEMASLLEDSASTFSNRFISEPETRYLDNSILQPCLAHDLPAGSLVSSKDLIFRRQGREVLTNEQIVIEQTNGRVLNQDMTATQGLARSSFRDAKISVLVACRMKSSRLKNKALLEIAGKPAVERCLENCMMLPRADSVVLATSTEADDAVLETMTLGGKVGFHRGDPEDVLKRYLDVTRRDGIDIIIRVTADMPLVSPEITEYLIDSHLASGADFTRAEVDAVGTAPHIINVSAMEKVVAMLGGSPMSEYMNWYFENNTDIFKVNIIDLPPDLVRDYRLTLDYQADLDMLNALYTALDAAEKPTILRNVFEILDSNPEMAAINGDQNIVYKTDTALIEKLKADTKITKSS